MEILILGVILVGLMVYASTKIKKTAAGAFEAETVETDDFIIKKPDGMLNVINGDPVYAFQSYSKGYGAAGAENIRLANAKLTVSDDVSLDKAAARSKSGLDDASELSEVIGEHRYRLLEGTRSEDGFRFRVFHKLAEKNGRAFDLETSVLASASAEFIGEIETMIASFEIK